MKKRISILAIATLSLMIALAPTAAGASTKQAPAKPASKQAFVCNFINSAQSSSFKYYNQNNWLQNGWLQFLQNQENRRNCPVTQNTVDTLVSNGNFKTLVAAVGAAGLANTVATANATVFAPTDQAFAKLPAGTVQALLNDIPTLTKILTYHVVGGTVPASTAKTLTSAPTLAEQNVAISIRNGSLFINNSRVVLYDIKTTNGIIHVIDTVLIPA